MRAPVLITVVFAALFGCDERNPPVPGGMLPPGGGTGADARPNTDAASGDASTSEVTISGRLCIVLDPQDPLVCPTEDATGAPLDLSGITITEVGGGTTTTMADGTFSIMATSIDAPVLVATSPALRPTAVRVQISGPFNNILFPAFDAATWISLTNNLGVIEAPNQGAAAVYITQNLTAAVGAEVVQPVGSVYSPFYDRDGGPLDFSVQGLSGDKGAALLFGVPVPVDETSYTVIGSGGSPLVDVPLDVLDATTTVSFVNL